MLNSDKEMSDLYFNLYMSCLKYKNEKEKKEKYNKDINCNEFFIKFQHFSNKYISEKHGDN